MCINDAYQPVNQSYSTNISALIFEEVEGAHCYPATRAEGRSRKHQPGGGIFQTLLSQFYSASEILLF